MNIIADDMSNGESDTAATYTLTNAFSTTLSTTTTTTTTGAAATAVRASISPTNVVVVDDCSCRRLELEASINLIALSAGGHRQLIVPTTMVRVTSSSSSSAHDHHGVARTEGNKHNSCNKKERTKMVRFSDPIQAHQRPRKQARWDDPVHTTSCHAPPPPPPPPLCLTTTQWSPSERTVSFPMPPLQQQRQQLRNLNWHSRPRGGATVGSSSFFSDTWDRVNRVCDAMDDTPTDRQAFVRELFARSLHFRRVSIPFTPTQSNTGRNR